MYPTRQREQKNTECKLCMESIYSSSCDFPPQHLNFFHCKRDAKKRLSAISILTNDLFFCWGFSQMAYPCNLGCIIETDSCRKHKGSDHPGLLESPIAPNYNSVAGNSELIQNSKRVEYHVYFISQFCVFLSWRKGFHGNNVRVSVGKQKAGNSGPSALRFLCDHDSTASFLVHF